MQVLAVVEDCSNNFSSNSSRDQKHLAEGAKVDRQNAIVCPQITLYLACYQMVLPNQKNLSLSVSCSRKCFQSFMQRCVSYLSPDPKKLSIIWMELRFLIQDLINHKSRFYISNAPHGTFTISYPTSIITLFPVPITCVDFSKLTSVLPFQASFCLQMKFCFSQQFHFNCKQVCIQAVLSLLPVVDTIFNDIGLERSLGTMFQTIGSEFGGHLHA